MPNVIFPMPAEERLMEFMVENCQLGTTLLEFRDISQTMLRKQYHPVAAGCLNGVQYALKLAKTHSFPVRTQFDYSSESASDKNLYWLREMQEKIMRPISRAPQMRPDLPDIVPYPPSELGVYRLKSKCLIDGREGRKLAQRWMPKPTAIRALLHGWHKELCVFHQSYAYKLDHPYQLTPVDISALSAKAAEMHFQLVCIKPFLGGNGRVARFVENVLRLRWGLAWKTRHGTGNQKVAYINELIDYEDSKHWQDRLTELNAREPK